MPASPAPPCANATPSNATPANVPPSNSAAPHPGSTHPGLPAAGDAVAHTLLNCLLREVCGPGTHTVADGRLLLRLPASGVRLRVAVRRASLLGAHRFTGGVNVFRDGRWRPVDWRGLGRLVRDELDLATGTANEEFEAQLAASHDGVNAGLAAAPDRSAAVPGHSAVVPGRSPVGGRYLESERALVFGHRFHPTPKARSGGPAAWARYAPETSAAFPLRLLAVRDEFVARECARPGADAPLDRLGPVPRGFSLLPAHPWQYGLLRGSPPLRAAAERGDVIDLGTGGEEFAPTASVRTLYGADAFLKFSLNVRITNCLRKNASYELTGAVALTRLLAPALDALAARFPGTGMLREPAYRSLALPGPGGRPDRELLEGFGVIVRDGLDGMLRPGVTALLAAAVADEYPTSSAHLSRLLGPGGAPRALRWWRRYLRLLVPPVLAAYFDHGVVLEPHLQNVLVAVGDDGMPEQVLFRDLEGTKLLAGRHAGALAALPPDVAGALAYDERRGWDRVVYCLVVNNAAETLAVLADLHPRLEPRLWEEVRAVLAESAEAHGHPGPLRALVAGEPLPAKANLLTRWRRRADREADYVRLPSPLRLASPLAGGSPPGAGTGAGPAESVPTHRGA